MVACHDIDPATEWGFQAVEMMGAAVCSGCTTFPLTPQTGNTVSNAITRNRYHDGDCGEAQEWLMDLQLSGKIRSYEHQSPGDMADLHKSSNDAEVHLSDLSLSSVNETAKSLYHEAYHNFHPDDTEPGFDSRAESFALSCISTR